MFETMHHYCIECRKETPYVLKKKEITKVIREEECTFTITIAQCAECGSEMNVPGLIDLNVKEIDAQYRKDKNLVTMEDIEKLMKIYHIGKAPLSLALGFGEITINRYLAGQLPSEEYSDVIKIQIAIKNEKILDNLRQKEINVKRVRFIKKIYA